MANYCDYSIHVRGRPEDVNSFIEVIQRKSESHRFPDQRIYEADVYQLDDVGDGLVVAGICGDCAWSVYSCMIDSPRTDVPGITTLQNESKRLHLDIEVWAQEIGIGFQEHYLF